MSQQGIFSIAPDAQTSGPSHNQVNGGENGSPFTSVSDEPSQAPDQASPFTAVHESPFQQPRGAEASGRNGGGIPERRPEGQPSALGGGAPEPETTAQAEPAAEAHVFQSANDHGGGAFQMNGFPEQAGGQMMEAAPVAPAAPVQEASPFVAVQHERPDYEAAKAGLEPQQDFAAVHPRYTAAQPAQAPQPAVSTQQAQPQSQPVYAPQRDVPAAQAPPSAVHPASEPKAVTPAFQQLELRAIFGVDHVLDMNQILQRARTLPGIRNVAVVGQQEAQALSNFRHAIQGMGLGDANEMKLNSGGGTVDFITEGETTVAVLLEGSYAPGVLETLMIVAREIGKLA